IRKKYSNYLGRYYWKPYFWSRSYCLISTGGASIDIIKKYIQNQNKSKFIF
ncbi:transposase, partial [Borreliella americana]